jgi:hypothetical protein
MGTQHVTGSGVDNVALHNYEEGISDIFIEGLVPFDQLSDYWPEHYSDKVVEQLVDHPVIDAEHLKPIISKPHCLCIDSESVDDFCYECNCDEMFAQAKMGTTRVLY